MNKITKEVKIGIAFIIALFLLYFGINFLKGVNIFKPANSYVVAFDNVTGMLQADPVTVNGLKIGQVHEMRLDAKGKKVYVDIQMDKGVMIPKGSKLSLDAAMLGGSTLLLVPNSDSNEFYLPGDTLMGEKKSGMMDVAARLIPQVEGLLPKLDSIMNGLNAVMNNPDLTSSLANVNSITGEFAKSSKEINKMLLTLNNDLPTISKNLVSTTDNLAHQVNGIDLVKTFNKVDSTMANVQFLSSKLTSKDSSIGLLLNDRQLYDSLNVTLGNASMLMKDVKENPSRYINVKVF